MNDFIKTCVTVSKAVVHNCKKKKKKKKKKKVKMKRKKKNQAYSKPYKSLVQKAAWSNVETDKGIEISC